MREITEGMLERYHARAVQLLGADRVKHRLVEAFVDGAAGRRAALKLLRNLMQPKNRRQLARAFRRHK